MIESTGTSNDIETLKRLRGEKMAGVLRTNGRGNINSNTIIIIFESRYALEFSRSNGTFWLVEPREVEKIINKKREEFETAKNNLEYILEMAGEEICSC